MNLEKFFETAGKLKSVKRTGWVERGVGGAESVADHSFMMALMCMVIPAKGIDRGKAVRMALVHDMAECITGDIITKENWKERGTMSAKDKSEMEKRTIKDLCRNLDDASAKEIISLWEEFDEGESKEASLVRDLDVAEMIMQASIYHKSGNFKKPLAGFWDETNMGKIRDESIKALVRKIIGKE